MTSLVPVQPVCSSHMCTHSAVCCSMLRLRGHFYLSMPLIMLHFWTHTLIRFHNHNVLSVGSSIPNCRGGLWLAASITRTIQIDAFMSSLRMRICFYYYFCEDQRARVLYLKATYMYNFITIPSLVHSSTWICPFSRFFGLQQYLLKTPIQTNPKISTHIIIIWEHLWRRYCQCQFGCSLAFCRQHSHFPAYKESHGSRS